MTIRKVGFFKEYRPDLLERFLRANIPFSDNKDNATDKSKSVLQHESLQLAIISATPKSPLQKGPADFHF